MAKVNFTSALKRFFPDLEEMEIPATSVVEIVEKLNEKFPGFSGYIVDDQGALRQHVNIFVNNTLVSDKKKLTDAVNPEDEVYILQALSGG